MIRKLFNNRLFIIGLAVCSGLFMLRSLAAPYFDEHDFSDVEAPAFDLEEEVPAQLEVVASNTGIAQNGRPQGESEIWRAEQSVLSGQLTWNGAPARDPFSGIGDPSIVSATPEPGEGLPVVVGVPRLDALVAGPDSLLAVLNDQIVREGDLIGGYEVTRIAPDGVRLASTHTSHWLAVSDMETGMPNEKAIAELETFDMPANEFAGPVTSPEPGG